MPQFVQQVAGKSYSLVEPRLGWVRSKSSLVNGVCGKIATIVPPVLATTDKYIDSTVEVVSSKACAVQESVTTKVAPVQNKIVEIQGLLVVKGLNFVNSSECMIDKLIPLPEKPTEEQKSAEQQRTIVSRIARLPYRAPVRVTCLVYIKANGVVESVVLTSRQAAGIMYEKQAQFAQQMMARAKPLTDRVQVIAEAGATHMRARRASTAKAIEDSREYTYIRVNNVLVRLRVVEAKDWTLAQSERVRSNFVALLLTAVQMGHGIGSRVIGQERTTFVFSKLHLPLQLKDVAAPPAAAVAQQVLATQAMTTPAAKLVQEPGVGPIAENTPVPPAAAVAPVAPSAPASPAAPAAQVTTKPAAKLQAPKVEPLTG
jgi:hypothetical protein